MDIDGQWENIVAALEENVFEENEKAQALLKRIWEVEGEGETLTDSLKNDPVWKEVVSE